MRGFSVFLLCAGTLVGFGAHAQLPGARGADTTTVSSDAPYPYTLPDEKGFLELRRLALESLKKQGAAGEKLATYYEKTYFEKLPKKLDPTSVEFARAFLA